MRSAETTPPASKEILVIEDSAPVELDVNHLEANGIVGFNRKDVRARPFNLLRTQLMKRLAATGGKVVGVTSTAPGAGKSFTTVNLAISLSHFAKFPVVVVDLDFRRGSIAGYLGLEIEHGVAEVLAGERRIEDIAIRAGVANLTVLPAVTGDESGSALLVSDAFDELIAQVRALAGDGVALVDLPPVFADDDALIATQKLDGYVLVADSGVTPAGQIADSIERLKPATCIGSVLNRHNGGILDRYGYGYGYAYGYGYGYGHGKS